jgi:exoribonuclease-2
MTNQHQNHRDLLSSLAFSAMIERGLKPEFSHEALSQLRHIRQSVYENQSTPMPRGVQDQRDLPWCSIDNDDSRDLDQLTVCRPQTDGSLIVMVAIADVDALVVKNSPIDRHAHENTTSVYTSARVFPMLPDDLSTDLTSLGEGVDRLAMVCEMHFDHLGAELSYKIYRSMVCNQAKLAYDSVSDWLEGKGPLPEAASRNAQISEQLRLQDDLAQKLRELRHARGALEFQSIQPRALFKDGRVHDLQEQPHNRARQLIEEFMICANTCIARFLAQKGYSSLRRVVRSPERWAKIVKVAAQYGEHLRAEPDSLALERFLAKRRAAEPLTFPDLSLVIVKLMGSGEYVLERAKDASSVGHFGLAVMHYTHSTAPNRRYPDLITQRVLKAALLGANSPYTNAELEQLALHCTTQEDASKKVERQIRKSEAALMLHTRVGQRFKGVVSGVNETGHWVRIFSPPAEGKIMGLHEQLALGQAITVRLQHTYVERGFIDFELS